jgi:hypothetical protein
MNLVINPKAFYERKNKYSLVEKRPKNSGSPAFAICR